MITPEEVKEKAIERFWSKIKFDEPDKCWEWIRYCNRQGYGRFMVFENKVRKVFLAHRYMYLKIYQIFNTKLHVLHKCDNPKCVNPNHLWLGTYQDNMDDMIAKGRDRHDVVFRGSENGMAKLTEDKVRIIKMRIEVGECRAKIARSFGINRTIITRIAKGTTWKHVV